MTRYRPGDRVWSKSAAKNCPQLLHRSGVVLRSEQGAYGHEVLSVRFDPPKGLEVGEEVRDWFASFFLPEAQAPKQSGDTSKSLQIGRTARAPRLVLKHPTDTRTEAQKEDSAKALLASWGYEVLQVGRVHKPAICRECLREAGGVWSRARVFCPKHNKPVYSMHSGSDSGVSDWQVRHCGRWPKWGVLLVENKRDAKAKRQEAQVRNEASGWFPVVDIGNITELCCTILEFEEDVLRVDPNPLIVAYLRSRPRREEEK